MASPSPQPSVRVLVVDDHELFADALRMFLERDERIEVVGVASSGQEAIDLAQTRLADVVLMDIFMRGMDGLEATKRLLALRPETHVIVLTGLSGDEIGGEARAAGPAWARGASARSSCPWKTPGRVATSLTSPASQSR